MNKHEPIEPVEDNCDAPTSSQVYVGLGWTKDIIVMRANDVTADSQALFTAIKGLVESFNRHSMVSVKEASRAITVAATSLQVTARKINDDASVLQRKAGEHLNRKARI